MQPSGTPRTRKTRVGALEAATVTMRAAQTHALDRARGGLSSEILQSVATSLQRARLTSAQRPSA